MIKSTIKQFQDSLLVKWTRDFILVLSIGLLIHSQAQAIVVFMRGVDEPVVGFLESRDASGIAVLVQKPNGEQERLFINTTEIEDVLETVSPQRLATLTPENPLEYRNYAEELAQKKIDPEARAMSLRLYLIAAHLSPKKLGKSSLLGMTTLARSAQEEKRFRAMAYLLDPNHDRSLLEEANPNSLKTDKQLEDQKKQLLSCIRMLRSGFHSQAGKLLAQQEVQQSIQKFTPRLAHKDYLELAAGTCVGCDNGVIPPHMMQKLLEAELLLMPVAAGQSPAEVDIKQKWSFYLDARFHNPLPVLSLEHLTEFDPSKSVFKNNSWVQP